MYIPKYKKLFFVVIFLARVFFVLKKLLHTVRNKIKKVSWQLVKKKKSYSMSKPVLKMLKKLKIFSFLGIFLTLNNILVFQPIVMILFLFCPLPCIATFFR